MTVATNTTEGQVILSGDLTGTGSAPELRASGVVPGTYRIPSIVVDAKGRVIFARELTDEEVVDLIPLASTTVTGLWAPAINGGLSTSSDSVTLLRASSTVLGGIRTDGVTTAVNGSGDLSVQMPDASADVFGIARIGSNLSISGGLLSRNGWGLATSTVNGMVKVNTASNAGFTISDPATGTVQARVATNNDVGLVTLEMDIIKGGINIGAPGFDGTQTIGVHGADNDWAGIIYNPAGEFEPGSGLSIDNNGFLNYAGFTPGSYPTASAGTLGIVRVGSGLEVESNGFLHVIGQARARTDYLGVVRPGENFNITVDGILSARLAQNGVSGVVRVVPTSTNVIFFDGSGNLNLRKGDSASGVVQLAAGGNAGLTLTNGNIEVDSTILRTNQIFSANTAQIFQGNIIEYNISTNFEIPAPSVRTPGTVYQIILRKSIQSATYSMGTAFRLNRPLNNSFTTSQALKITLICVSEGNSGILVLQSAPFNL